jgi:hypothetical protein
MVKTLKGRKMKGSTSKSCKHRQATMHGLNKWYERMFEELGWIVLAKKKGMTDKVEVYKHSLQRLQTHLECKMKSVHEHDRKTDLGILLENVKTLTEHAVKDF